MRTVKGILFLLPLILVVAAILCSSHYDPEVFKVAKTVYHVFSAVIFSVVGIVALIVVTFFARVGILYLFRINIGLKTQGSNVSKD